MPGIFSFISTGRCEREVTKQLLEASGYKVIAAMDGVDTVEKYNENKERIQLLIFDSVMPKKSGKKSYE